MDLSDAYDNGGHIPGAAAYPPRWMQQAATFRDAMGDRLRPALPYGSGPREAFDLFLPEGAAQGLVVFVHGGYWLKFDRSVWSHLAAGPLARGWAVAMPSYDLCPAIRISGITRQIAAAITVAATEIPGPIRLTGHSAGGHLVARMTDPAALAPAIAARLARVVPISPLSDLRPLMHTAMNRGLQLDEQEAEAESPVLMPAPAVPVTTWVGGDERPAFVDQARWLNEAWHCEGVIDPGRHHFDVIDALADPDSPLVATLLS